jgi:hypothetical protein
MQQPEFIIFLVGIFSGLIVALWLIYWVYRAKLLEREERRMMIERGMTPPAPVPAGWPGVRIREMELKAEERRLRIEKGLEVPRDDTVDQPGGLAARLTQTPEAYLRKGLIALHAGTGLFVALALVKYNLDLTAPNTHDWILALSIAGPVVSLYGMAHIVFYRLAKDRLRETMSTGHGPAR